MTAGPVKLMHMLISSVASPEAQVKRTDTAASRDCGIENVATRSPSSVAQLPRCFADHGPAQSTCTLFASWVRQADATDSGRIEVRLDAQPNPATGKPFSRRTVGLALRWLTARHLLMRTRRGGRGRGSSYFVRWSFNDTALSGRQASVNHSPKVYTWKRDENADGNCVRGQASEERNVKTTPKTSSCKDMSQRRPASPIRLQNFSTDRAYRFVAAQIRAAVREALPDLCKPLQNQGINAMNAMVHREFHTGRLHPGSRLGRFVGEFCARVFGIPGTDLMDTLYAADDEYRNGDPESWTVAETRQALLSFSYWQCSEAQRATA